MTEGPMNLSSVLDTLFKCGRGTLALNHYPSALCCCIGLSLHRMRPKNSYFCENSSIQIRFDSIDSLKLSCNKRAERFDWSSVRCQSQQTWKRADSEVVFVENGSDKSAAVIVDGWTVLAAHLQPLTINAAGSDSQEVSLNQRSVEFSQVRQRSPTHFRFDVRKCLARVGPKVSFFPVYLTFKGVKFILIIYKLWQSSTGALV